MSLLVAIIGGLLLLSVAVFAWAMVMKRVHTRKAFEQGLNGAQPISVDPMQRAVRPKNPHAAKARGADAAQRNFAPTAVHGHAAKSRSHQQSQLAG